MEGVGEWRKYGSGGSGGGRVKGLGERREWESMGVEGVEGVRE